ncbi:pentapeptide repeat-containing protein [Actinomadura napierensis]|uniref:Pentapeptide repeat-containing protein n=1 Tax=Actinomadura napierensis TaxID=267854 RepID=A0ABP5K7E6_9ACTN
MLSINAAATVWRMERWTEPLMAARLEEALEEALTGGDWAAALGERPPFELETDLGGAPLAGRDLTGIDLTRAVLDFADLSRADLTGAVLLDVSARHTDLSGTVLVDADLSASRLSEARLTGCRASGLRAVQTTVLTCDLSGADLTGADLTGGIWTGNLTDPAAFEAAVTTGTQNSYPATTWHATSPRHGEALSALAGERDAARARWAAPEQAANLEDVIRAAKRGDDWTDARYPASDGNYTDLQGAPLAGRDLRGVDLFGAELDHADLSGADLTGARLNKITTVGADFTGALLDGADLHWAVLSRGDFTRARFRNATVHHVLFVNAVLDSADFTAATITDTTMYGATRGGTLLDHATTDGLRH